jgi:transcriptional regulator with XRE-family HTH domain
MLEYDRKELGQHLRSNRERANLTQGQVSDRLGYSSPQFISNIERGISVVPLDTLAKMLRLYKANPNKATDIILTSQQQLLLEKLRKEAKLKPKN